MTRQWLYRYLVAPAVRDQIVGCSNGGAINMLKVVGRDISRVALPTQRAYQASTDVV